MICKGNSGKIVIVCVCMLLSGCFTPTFDATSAETQKSSLRKMQGGLSSGQKEKFADSLEYLMRNEKYILGLVSGDQVPSIGLEKFLDGRRVEDIIMTVKRAKQKKGNDDMCAQLNKAAGEIVNYEVRQLKINKKLSLAPVVLSALGLHNKKVSIGGEPKNMDEGLYFFIYSEKDRKTLTAMHTGCVDKYGAPKIAFWDFLKGGGMVWY